MVALRRLEQRGLITRTRDPDGTRGVRNALTRRGRRQVALGNKLCVAAQDKVLAVLDDRDQSTLRDLMARVADARQIDPLALD
jgi:DNA-binding MarR family transcriptional regulator